MLLEDFDFGSIFEGLDLGDFDFNAFIKQIQDIFEDILEFFSGLFGKDAA